MLLVVTITGNIEIMQQLIDKGIGIKAKDNLGRTAMQCECVLFRQKITTSLHRATPLCSCSLFLDSDVLCPMSDFAELDGRIPGRNPKKFAFETCGTHPKEF